MKAMVSNLYPVVLLVFLLVSWGGAHPHNESCIPLDQNPHKPRNVLEATDWLTRFGYISTFKSWSQGANALQALDEAIAVFQELANIKITGKLDDLTLEWMGKDRCGVPDVIRRRGKLRLKRNAGALKWKKHHLTYIVTRYTPDLPRGQVDRTLAEAFQVWADVTPLTFTKSATKDHVDIEIKFVHGVHGDNNPFDGEGGVLAHAFFPPSYPGNVIGGDTHFDESEQWTIELDDNAPGRRLFCVAVHEFGHALGLDHSDQQGSIMWPWSQGCGNGTLDPSDIVNIQWLYGRPGATTDPPTTTTSTRKPETKPTKRSTTKTSQTPTTRAAKKPTTRRRKPPKRTNPTTTSTLATTKRRRKPTKRTIAPTSTLTTRTTQSSTKAFQTSLKQTRRVGPTRCTRCPVRTTPITTASTLATSTLHPNPVCSGGGKIDAVDVAADGNTYAFKGSQIFRFDNDKIHPDFPKPIGDVFSPSPDTVDAAVTYYYKTRWTRRVKYITYLFKNELVWRYEYKRKNLLRLWEPKVFDIVRGYPKHMSEDFGINVDRIDAAFKLKKRNTLYITKGNLIWEIQIHKSGLKKKKKPKLLSRDPALSYLPPLDSAALFDKGGFFFFSGDYYHRLVPVDRRRARWFWPRYTLSSWFECSFDDAVVPLKLEAEGKKNFAKEIRL